MLKIQNGRRSGENRIARSRERVAAQPGLGGEPLTMARDKERIT
jgi:hypothetical protein